MPIVKMSWVKAPEALEKYLSKDRDSRTIESASESPDDSMSTAIRDEHARFETSAQNLAVTVIQSWHAKESDLAAPEKYNEMGQELAKRFAPGHLSWVVTHTEKDHIHNHIVICSAHSETGKLLQNKKSTLKHLHEVNNTIARENGFGVLGPRVNDLEAKLPEKVKAMVSRGKKSWLFDMVQKADFSRAASTSFDEYVGVMKGLGVDVRVEDKNISYLYGSNTKAVRGKSLGKNFDKDGLMKAFKENDEKFAKHPGLRARIRSDIGAAFDGKGNPLGTPSDLLLESGSHPGLGKKDYGKFTKVDRSRTRNELPPIFDERGGVLYQEMKRAQQVSILDYCVQHKIQTKQNEKGETVLRGREFVVLGKSEWTNTKNRTKGTIIDFVAIHDESTYLHAVAKINGNPRLLLLEQAMGEYKRGYQAFYMPKPKAAAPGEAQKTLQAFLNSRGVRGVDTETLHKSRGVHVGQDRSIWLLNEKSDSALEIKEDKDGQWRTKRHGKPSGVFFEQIGKGKKITVFHDPFDFLLAHGKGAVSPHGGASLFVGLGEGSERRLDEIMALNPHITEIHLAHSARAEEREMDKAAAHKVRARFNPFDIEVKEVSSGPARERGRGPDISM